MKKVILTTLTLLAFTLMASNASAAKDSDSASDRLQFSIPEMVELDTSALSDLEIQIPRGKSSSLPTRISLRSNSEWFVQTSALSSLLSGVQNSSTEGSANRDESSQDADLVLTQKGSWSDEAGETVVVYSITPGL